MAFTMCKHFPNFLNKYQSYTQRLPGRLKSTIFNCVQKKKGRGGGMNKLSRSKGTLDLIHFESSVTRGTNRKCAYTGCGYTGSPVIVRLHCHVGQCCSQQWAQKLPKFLHLLKVKNTGKLVAYIILKTDPPRNTYTQIGQDFKELSKGSYYVRIHIIQCIQSIYIIQFLFQTIIQKTGKTLYGSL